MIEVKYGEDESKGYKRKDELKSVYIIESSTGEIKIGITKCINARISSFKTNSTLDFKVLYLSEKISNALEIEKMLHLKYDKHKMRGEWFKLNKDTLLKEVSELVEKHGEIRLLTKEYVERKSEEFKESMDNFYKLRFCERELKRYIEEGYLKYFIDFETGWHITEEDRELIENEIQDMIDFQKDLEEFEDAKEYEELLEKIKNNSLEECKEDIQNYSYTLFESVHFYEEYYADSDILELIKKSIIDTSEENALKRIYKTVKRI